MTPELGHLALSLAFCLSILLALLPAFGLRSRNTLWQASAPPLSAAIFLATVLAFAALAHAFLRDDFSVALTAAHSHTELPKFYKFGALWGNHEGSLLLWVLVLSLWTFLLARYPLPPLFRGRALAVLGALLAGFIGFSLFTANPFARHLPLAPAQGADLNPLLQDPAMMIHPPVLYIGYVGFAVPFALAMAAVTAPGAPEFRWTSWARPWAAVTWAFLTVGIALGSWWAYYELGWGGWWFWDPVENASFMPWLAGAALLHALLIAQRQGLFRSWAVLLAITCFAFSLLGAFLVRSGVLVSVHAFASDPARGIYLLLFLALSAGAAFALHRLRASQMSDARPLIYRSRAGLILLNNLLLTVAALTVLCGTLFPLVMAALGQGLYSVGAPYFNAVFAPLALLMMALMGVATALQGGRLPQPLLHIGLPLALSAAAGLGLALLWGKPFHWVAALGTGAATWVACGTLLRARRQSAGMTVAHLGFAACALGICLSTAYSVEKDVRLAPGETLEIAGHLLLFKEQRSLEEANYRAEELLFVLSEGEEETQLRPQKRYYTARQVVMTEAGIAPGLFRDWYIAPGEPLGEKGWTLRVQHKPFVRWIWLGALLMAAGGLLAVPGHLRSRSGTA